MDPWLHLSKIKELFNSHPKINKLVLTIDCESKKRMCPFGNIKLQLKTSLVGFNFSSKYFLHRSTNFYGTCPTIICTHSISMSFTHWLSSNPNPTTM